MYRRKEEVKTNLNQRDLYAGSKLSCLKTLASKGININAYCSGGEEHVPLSKAKNFTAFMCSAALINDTLWHRFCQHCS